jgi:ectoine hydroxylase-related dioxygenase (phytanoyl-CoA dioxygenase family)
MINQTHINKLKHQGYVVIKNFLKKDSLEKFLHNCKNVIDKSEKVEWPFLSVYNDYFHFNDKVNIFGINYPLNSFFRTDLFKLFNENEYSYIIKKLTRWKSFNTSLIRLHSFNQNYNYNGAWHRDDKNYPSPNSIQSVLYIKKESGFRIVPKNRVNQLRQLNIRISGEDTNKTYQNKELPNSIYEEIEASAGDLLFFESGLLHQGRCKGNRLHFHLRHVSSQQIYDDENNKMNFTNEFKENFRFKELEKIYPKYIIKKDFRERLRRLLRYVQYFFPRYKSIKNNFQEKSKLKENIFANTIWQ